MYERDRGRRIHPFHLKSNIAGLSVLAMLSAASSAASAQTLGTVFVDFAGATATPQGDVTALDATVFPQAPMMTFTTAQLKTAILNNIKDSYTGLPLTVTDVMPASGPFTRLVIGNTGTATGELGNALGVANEIDFRNKRAANIVSVLAGKHAPATGTMTLAQASQFVANTASHEVGHALGLVHSDVVSTYVGAAGTGISGETTVLKNELMAASADSTSAFLKLKFGAYSLTKLDISAKGIFVQPETGAGAFTLPTANDPDRAGDAGKDLATATQLNLSRDNRTCVLGSLDGELVDPNAVDNSDFYKFEGKAGDRLTVDLLSKTMYAGGRPAPFQTRIPDYVDAQIALLTSEGNYVAGQEWRNRSTNFDGIEGGDAGSDQLLYSFALPANGTYMLRVETNGNATDPDYKGKYEMLVIVPEPSSLALLTVAILPSLRRRRR